MKIDPKLQLITSLLLFLAVNVSRVKAQTDFDEVRTWTLTNGQKAQGQFIQFLPPTTSVWAEGKGVVRFKMLGIIANTALERLVPSDQKLIAQLAQKFPGPYCLVDNQLYPHWVISPPENSSPKEVGQETREEGELDLHGLALGMSDTKVIAILKAGGFTIGNADFVNNLSAQVTKELNHKSSNPDIEIDKKLPLVIRTMLASKRISDDNTTWQLSLEFIEDVTRDKDWIVLTKVKASLHSTALPMKQIRDEILDSLIAKFGKTESEKNLVWGNVSKEGNWRNQGDKISITGSTAQLENVPLEVYLNGELKKQYKERINKAFTEKLKLVKPLKI